MAWFKELVSMVGSMASGKRSSVLRPLQWLIGLLIAGLGVVLGLEGRDALVVLFGVLLSIAFLAFLVAYFAFAWKDPDALRSESYSLNKMAIERGMVGDSETPLSLDPATSAPALSEQLTRTEPTRTEEAT